MVPAASLVFIVLNMILGAAIPIALLRFIKKKYQVSVDSFFFGAGAMLVFALGLEQVVHAVVLSSAAGIAIQSNLWLYALYGGLMAGLFEETGRLVVMRFAMRKKHGDWHHALMYGAGHGGFEVFAILTLGMINNLLYSVMINAGQLDVLLEPLDPANRAVLLNAVEALKATPSWMFLMAPVERIGAVTAQIALSVIVWFAASGTRCNWKYYLLAVFLHFALDACSAVLSRIGCPVVVTELAILAMAAVCAVIAKRIRDGAISE